MQCVKRFATILMVSMLAACGTNTPAPKPTNDYCKIFIPLFDHPKDTKGTRDQVRDRNGTYECVCLNNCPKPKKTAPLGTVPAKNPA